MKKSINYLITITAIGVSLYYLYSAFYGALSPLQQRGILFFASLFIGFVLYSINGKKRNLSKEKVPIYDLILAIVFLASGIYFFIAVMPSRVLNRGVWGPTTFELIFGIIAMVVTLELTRRSVGMPIVIVALLFLGYAIFGPYLPGDLNHKGYTLFDLSEYLFWTTEGIFSIPLGACATFVIVFIIFGAFLDKLGGGEFFIKLAYSLAGHIKGGPALTSVISSALMGMISGSSVSNVVTTGTFTIPLMKKTGYRPLFAAAVEAVSSTGGQFMPPVMGVAAFVMSDMTDIPYWKIAVSAFIPAFLYFLSIGIMVYLEADKEGLEGIPKSETPPFWRTLGEGLHLIIPITILIYELMILKASPSKAGVYTVIATLIVGILEKYIKTRYIPWREILDALKAGTITMVPVVAASATAGLVIGIVSLTGLGVFFSKVIIQIAHGNLLGTLVLSMVACIILGMGVPTTAAYIITSILTVPVILKLGIGLLPAHLFVLYFAVLSFITPPVALSAYAASGIAGTNAMKTGYMAWKLGLAGFFVPFMFVFNPSLLLQGNIIDIIIYSIIAIMGILFLAISLEGWFGGGRLHILGRIGIFILILTLIKPNILTNLLALLGIVIILFIHKRFLSRNNTSMV